MSHLVLPAPAKLNLFLHITGRRTDGYHNLETVFQLLDHGDLLTFDTDCNGLELTCSEPALAGEDNLVMRAARLLTPHAGTPANVHIHLEKQLPAGGGLGGGSSDAATTLLGLNRLWECGLELGTLLQLGLGLGADVPVFLHGHSAFAHGVGEKLESLALPEQWYLVLTPRCSISTREIFQHPELTRDTPSTTMRAFPFLGSRNDCQAITCQLYPEVAATLAWLGQFGEARMTGTGASVFAAFPGREQALAALDRLPSAATGHLQGCRGFVARGVNQSPLLASLAKAD